MADALFLLNAEGGTPSRPPFQALTVANSKATDHGLKIGLIWWVIGMALASGYTLHTYRSFAGKLSVREAEAEDGEERDNFVAAPR